MANSLQQRIERTATKLASLKAQAQAREMREKAKNQLRTRQMRTRALILWGVALEREVQSEMNASTIVRELLTKHLRRPEDRTAALQLLDQLDAKAGTVEA